MVNAVVVSCASVIAYSRFDGHLTSERECLASQQYCCDVYCTLSTVTLWRRVGSSVVDRIPGTSCSGLVNILSLISMTKNICLVVEFIDATEF